MSTTTALTITSATKCPTVSCTGTSQGSSSFYSGTAEVEFCPECRARTGMISVQMRASDLASFLL